MDRGVLLDQLRAYLARHPTESATVERFRALLDARADCFERSCFEPGHVTASAWIVSRERHAVLLTHHRKLDRWLQLGGHTDGEADVLGAALREAREESGLERFDVLSPQGRVDAADAPAPILDLDVHDIPARGAEPRHVHYDVRFLLATSERSALARQVAESKALRWFPSATLAETIAEESLARMARKAAAWLAASGQGGPRGSPGDGSDLP